MKMAAAVHEAGHAIVAWALGLKVQELRIGAHGKGASIIEHDAHLPIVQRIAVAAAGMEAIDLLNAQVWELASSSDEAKIVDLLDDYRDTEHEHLRTRGRDHARQILSAHLGLIAELTGALTRSATLNAGDLSIFERRALP
jgi:ATP-dependent Zn protease